MLGYFAPGQRDLADAVRSVLGFEDEAFGVGRGVRADHHRADSPGAVTVALVLERADVPSALAEWEAVARCPKELVIAGGRRDARSGRTLPVEDPSAGEALCAVADAGRADCIDALDAAHEAQAAWAAAAPRDRARVLRRAADALEREAGRLAMLITLEMGKPLAESRDEVSFAAEYLEWSAEEAVRAGLHLRGARAAPRVMVTRRPVGPCLIVSPWNFPLAIPARGVAAALAAGCTVVLRPSALTPLSALALAEIVEDAGARPAS